MKKSIIISACFINFALVSMGFATSTGTLNQNINAALHSAHHIKVNHNEILSYAGQDIAQSNFPSAA